MPKTRVNGAQLHYELKGQGDRTIVFSHSMLFSCRMFDAQVAALQDRYRCLSFDFRGQGQSEVTESGYDLETLTEDTAGIITSLADPPVHFLGFSMGGMVGLRLAIRQPQLLRSLILVDTTAGLEEPAMRRKARILSFAARWLGTRAVAGQVMPLFFGQHFLQDPERQDQVRAWRGHFVANDRIGVTRAVRGVIGRQPIEAELDKINLPTLILNGEEDGLTRLERAQRMNQAIKESQLVTIPRSGHMSPVEEPEAVNAAVAAFLAELDG